MQDPYLDRVTAAKEIAQQIVVLCESYEAAPSQIAINHLLASAERLADLAEDIDVQQTLKALDA